MGGGENIGGGGENNARLCLSSLLFFLTFLPGIHKQMNLGYLAKYLISNHGKGSEENKIEHVSNSEGVEFSKRGSLFTYSGLWLLRSFPALYLSLSFQSDLITCHPLKNGIMMYVLCHNLIFFI